METEPESSDFTLVAGQLTFLLSIESENNTDFIEKFQNLDDEPRNELTKLAQMYMVNDSISEVDSDFGGMGV